MNPEPLAMVSESNMAKPCSSDGDGEWRFTYEALQNVRAVQLLLFHPRLSPLDDCPAFTAAVRQGHLRCTWGDAAPQGSLCVPLPAPCLLDLSSPPRCWTRADHVEVRIGLLSLDPALCRLGIQDELPQTDAQPFSVEFDAETLKSSEAVQFYCRECSCKLTNKPFRRVLEVPSMDWREVSEHFYGNCCCASFGAQAELLVARFQELLTPSEAKCLVASTTCIVHKGDVIAKEGDPSRIDGELIHHQNGVEVTTLGEETQEECEGEEAPCCPPSAEFSASKLAEETQELSVDGSHEGEDACCSSSKPPSAGSPATTGASPESLGNGFMTGPGWQSEVREWEPFLCWRCSSIIGARRGDGSKKGVQFFKCKISTHESNRAVCSSQEAQS